MRTRRPIVRASSASIEHHFVHRRKALTDALGPSRGGRHPGERGAGAQATCSPSQAMCQARVITAAMSATACARLARWDQAGCQRGRPTRRPGTHSRGSTARGRSRSPPGSRRTAGSTRAAPPRRPSGRCRSGAPRGGIIGHQQVNAARGRRRAHRAPSRSARASRATSLSLIMSLTVPRQ
jgi:hypothetical protein